MEELTENMGPNPQPNYVDHDYEGPRTADLESPSASSYEADTEQTFSTLQVETPNDTESIRAYFNQFYMARY
jgi:hypothetical protein